MQDFNTKGMFKWRKSKGVQASFNSQVCSALREFWLSGGSNHLYLSSSKFLLHPQRQCVHKLDKAHGGCDVCYQCTECRSFLYSLPSLNNPSFFSREGFLLKKEPKVDSDGHEVLRIRPSKPFLDCIVN